MFDKRIFYYKCVYEVSNDKHKKLIDIVLNSDQLAPFFDKAAEIFMEEFGEKATCISRIVTERIEDITKGK